MNKIVNLPEFSYEDVELRNLKVHGEFDQQGRLSVKKITFKNYEVIPTARFWMSMCSRFGFGTPVFRYFSHEEVFERLTTRSKSAKVRLTIQKTPALYEGCSAEEAWKPRLLAISSSNKPVVRFPELLTVLDRLGNVEDVQYREGRILTKHPLSRPIQWQIGPDMHNASLWLETAIDGYGQPTLYLSMIRLACLNQLVAVSKAFRAGIILSKAAIVETLHRAVESYSNEQGFVALRDRIASAQQSWASVYECVQLSKIIDHLGVGSFRPEFIATVPDAAKDPTKLRNHVLRKHFSLTGDLREIYGIAQLDTLSEKQQRMTASKATVYDLLCFASELATHQVTPPAAHELNSYAGRLVGSDIYDLEGSCDQFPEFKDFVDDNSRTAKESAA